MLRRIGIDSGIVGPVPAADLTEKLSALLQSNECVQMEE